MYIHFPKPVLLIIMLTKSIMIAPMTEEIPLNLVVKAIINNYSINLKFYSLFNYLNKIFN